MVTSRVEEHLNGVPRRTVTPLRIRGNRLSGFMEAYLTRRQRRELFDDAEYFEACRRLSEMVGERDTTVLMAKLYAEQMIAAKEGVRGIRLPENIPDLMLSYLNEINRNADRDDPDDRAVHNAAKIVAWECVRGTFRPMAARRADVTAHMEAERANHILTYMERRLRVIQTVGPAGDELRFTLDPVAEHLGALRVAEKLGGDGGGWRGLLQQIDAAEGSPQEIKGFLLALRDCLLAKGPTLGAPTWVGDSLSERLGLDPRMLEHAHLLQRVRRLTFNLHLPDVEDRVAAVEMLGRIGSDAASAIPDLEELAERDEGNVRAAVAEAIVRIRQ